MAQRDRSQGFGFVYVDIAALLANRNQFKEDFQSPIEKGEAQAINFQKLESDQSPLQPVEAKERESAPKENTAVKQIRENLDRLQSLHHKLHAMLAELNQISGKKK